MPKSYTVVDDYHDSRLDRWFTKNVINLPHSLIEKIIRQNKVKVNMVLIIICQLREKSPTKQSREARQPA